MNRGSSGTKATLTRPLRTRRPYFTFRRIPYRLAHRSQSESCSRSITRKFESGWLSRNRPGVALVAMDFDAVRGAAFLASKPDVVSTAVIGRHTKADLRLGKDPALSLRHLVLLLYPRTSGRAWSLVTDCSICALQSASWMSEERDCELWKLNGPAFVRCGRYPFCCFPRLKLVSSWPDDPEEAWKRIPDRLYLDEVETEERSREWEKEHDRAWEVDDLPRLKEPPTLVHHLAGPQMAVQELVDEGEPPLGEIRITSNRG